MYEVRLKRHVALRIFKRHLSGCLLTGAYANLLIVLASMGSNTLRFNRRVEALRLSRRSNVSSSRRQRGPSHGLQGDATSQRKSAARGTSSFRHSQVLKMQDKGAALEDRVLAYDLDLPEVVIAQEYGPGSPDVPMSYDATDHLGGGEGSIWVDQVDDDDDDQQGSEEDDTEIEKAARKVKVEYRDFRTKRQRTDTSNKHWEEQAEGMIDAYMDWCLGKSTGEALQPSNETSLWIDMINVFGLSSSYTLHNIT